MTTSLSNVVDIRVAACNKKLLRSIRTRIKSPAPTFRDAIKEVLTQEAMREYAAVPLDVLKQAIDASNRIVDAGGTFMEAMEAIEEIVQVNQKMQALTLEEQRNAKRIEVFYRRRDRLTEAMLSLVNRHIRDRLTHRTDTDIHYAILRARRVLEGGGTLGCALNQAIGPDLDGQGE